MTARGMVNALTQGADRLPCKVGPQMLHKCWMRQRAGTISGACLAVDDGTEKVDIWTACDEGKSSAWQPTIYVQRSHWQKLWWMLTACSMSGLLLATSSTMPIIRSSMWARFAMA